MVSNTRGNINGPFGQSGSLSFKSIAGPTYTLTEADGGLTLRVTGACVITLPVGTDNPRAGFFCTIYRMGAGAVSFIGGAGATVLSTAGATPAIVNQYAGAVVNVEEDNVTWLVAGALA